MKVKCYDAGERTSHLKLSIELDKALKKLTISKRHKIKFDLFWGAILVIMIIIIGIFVYFTGGTSSFVHLMYIPIIISVFIFGILGGAFIALFAGFIVGPYMPLSVAQGVMQRPFTWVLRIVMFIIIVLIVGLLVDYIKLTNDLEKKKAYMDILTGYPNYNKFKQDLTLALNEGMISPISIIIYEFENMETINRYVGYVTGQQSFIKLLNMADNYFVKGTVYSINSNKFLVVIPDYNCEDAYIIANKFSHKMKQPIYINGLPIAAIIKGGMDCFFLHSNKISDIIEKLEKALDQARSSRNDLMIYDNKFAQESAEQYNTLVSVYRALQNDTFSLVYQPKVSLKNNELVGVEALLRWNDSEFCNMPISHVIKIAEDAGFISQITKWVIKNAVLQLKKWQEEGIEINIAINLSSRDLNDSSIVEFTRECLESFHIEPSLLEFELTERSIIEDEDKVFLILNKIKNMGIKVSLDDYGTGHNSLMYITKLLFKFNYIKIDKLFIDEIENDNNKTLIEGIIRAAHGFGIEVIGEGVESEEQLNILKEIECDIVQGYYYSKPLVPKELNNFIKRTRAI